jgi:hypothetical protein
MKRPSNQVAWGDTKFTVIGGGNGTSTYEVSFLDYLVRRTYKRKGEVDKCLIYQVRDEIPP